MDRDDRVLQPIAQSDGTAGQYCDPPYRAGAVPLQQHLLKALPWAEHVLVWGEARVKPKPGVPLQAPPSSTIPSKSSSASALVQQASSSRPHSYAEAVQSDGKKLPSMGAAPRVVPSSSNVSGIRQPATSGSSVGYGLGSGLKKTVETSSGHESNLKKPSTLVGSYGLESDLRKSSSTDYTGKKSSPPATKAGGVYGLDSDLRTSSASSLAKKPSAKDDDYGLLDEELELPTETPTSSAAAQRYGRASTPDGPGTPRTGSPSGVTDRPLSGGGSSRLLPGIGMGTTVMPHVGGSLSGASTYKPTSSSGIGKSYY